jgi:hypothetical protein
LEETIPWFNDDIIVISDEEEDEESSGTPLLTPIKGEGETIDPELRRKV